MKKIVVTGGSGFIGTNLVNYLLKKKSLSSILIIYHMHQTNIINLLKIIKIIDFTKQILVIKKKLKVY